METMEERQKREEEQRKIVRYKRWLAGMFAK